MKRTDLKDKQRVTVRGEGLTVAIQHVRADAPGLVMLLDPDTLTPKPIWEDPAGMTALPAQASGRAQP